MSARAAAGPRRKAHDEHHRGPERVEPRGPADYLEVMARAMFQAGISWRVVDAKWEGIREAFAGFDPERVAAMTPADVERLMGDPRVIRNRRKVEGLIDNAHTFLALERQFGVFEGYLRSFRDYDSLAEDMSRRFKWLGESGVYYFLWVVGEPVPPYDEWAASRRAHAR
ncbi:MAG: DNA-3-methyladenine glycosylase I [Coriobacteriia bacterium]|nr:DNA-3-methyladenine glycosylase I [Coriobacteriia bacterium]